MCCTYTVSDNWCATSLLDVPGMFSATIMFTLQCSILESYSFAVIIRFQSDGVFSNYSEA